MAIIGATVSETAAADTTVNLGITCIVRNICDCDSSILSLVLGGVASTISNLAVTVIKL